MRIVSLTPIATETLVLLGLEDEIVGITPLLQGLPEQARGEDHSRDVPQGLL